MIRASDFSLYKPAPKNQGRLMALGEFVFELSTLPFQQIERHNSWKHPASEPVGADPVYQFTGAGAETLAFSGVIYKEFSNPQALDTLRRMAATGEAYVLVGVQGNIYGFYVIDDVSETGSYFDDDGQAQRVEFNVKLTLAQSTKVPRDVNGNTTTPANSKSTKS